MCRIEAGMKMKKVILFHTMIVLLAIACTDQKFDYPQRQMPADISQDRQGYEWAEQTFLDKCAYCHGHENEGRGPRADFFDPPAPDFSEHKYRTTDPAYLFWRIAEGKTAEPFLSRGSVMPAWGMHFTDRQIWLLVDYLKTRAEAGGA